MNTKAKVTKHGTTKGLSDEDIYLIIMLHKYQHMSCEKIARRFDQPSGRIRDIIAGRSHSACCG